MTEKFDFKKALESYQAKRGKFRIVEIPTMQYLMIDGHGDPNAAPAYVQALEALYPVAYKLKFISKRELGRDYVVPPLEGLWWADDMTVFTTARDKSQWHWTMTIMAPEWIDSEVFSVAMVQAGAKKPPGRLGEVRLDSLTEGTCVQSLHIGSYDDEAPVLEATHQAFIPEHGFKLTGRHHEVYFSDPRKTAPEKLRTLLRQPVTT